MGERVGVMGGEFKNMLVVHLKYENLMKERNYVLTHLGQPQPQGQVGGERGREKERVCVCGL